MCQNLWLFKSVLHNIWCYISCNIPVPWCFDSAPNWGSFWRIPWRVQLHPAGADWLDPRFGWFWRDYWGGGGEGGGAVEGDLLISAKPGKRILPSKSLLSKHTLGCLQIKGDFTVRWCLLSNMQINPQHQNPFSVPTTQPPYRVDPIILSINAKSKVNLLKLWSRTSEHWNQVKLVKFLKIVKLLKLVQVMKIAKLAYLVKLWTRETSAPWHTSETSDKY